MYKESYLHCVETKDGKYILPDNMIVEAVGQSDISDSFTIISDYSEYKSIQSQTINTEWDFFGVLGGKFSQEIERA